MPQTCNSLSGEVVKLDLLQRMNKFGFVSGSRNWDGIE